MNDYTNINKKSKSFNIIVSILFLISVIGLLFLDILSSIEGTIWSILFTIDIIIVVACYLTIILMYYFNRKNINKIENKLNMLMPIGYKFSYTNIFCEDYVLDSKYTDKAVIATSMLEGMIDDVEIQRFHIELSNATPQYSSMEKILASFYVYKNLFESDITCYIMPNDYNWENKLDDIKCYSSDNIKIYSNDYISFHELNINIDAPYFISINKNNLYLYIFNTVDALQISNLNNDNKFLLEVRNEIEKIEHIYCQLKNIIKRNS